GSKKQYQNPRRHTRTRRAAIQRGRADPTRHAGSDPQQHERYKQQNQNDREQTTDKVTCFGNRDHEGEDRPRGDVVGCRAGKGGAAQRGFGQSTLVQDAGQDREGGNAHGNANEQGESQEGGVGSGQRGEQKERRDYTQ